MPGDVLWGDVLLQVTFCGVTFCGVMFCGVTFCGVTFCRGTENILFQNRTFMLCSLIISSSEYSKRSNRQVEDVS